MKSTRIRNKRTNLVCNPEEEGKVAKSIASPSSEDPYPNARKTETEVSFCDRNSKQITSLPVIYPVQISNSPKDKIINTKSNITANFFRR